MYDLVLKNGKVFLADRFVDLDLAISGEKIAAIGKNLSGARNINAANRWVLPGIIDAHTHFSLPFAGAVSADDFFTGTRAGAIGGVTTIIDFTAQQGEEGILAGLIRRKAQAAELAAIDYSFHACIGRFSEQVAAEMPQLLTQGLSSLKIFTAYGRSGLMQSDFNLLRIMKKCQEQGILLTVHAENGPLIDDLTAALSPEELIGIAALCKTRPVITEVEAIARVGAFARLTGCQTYIVHTSSGAGALTIASLRKNQTPIIGETCPQYLYLDDSLLQEPNGHYFSCCPPLRPVEEKAALWENLNNGNLAVIATDHCPFKRNDKDSWQKSISKLPMGLPGIETLVPLALQQNKGLPTATAIRALTENPARIFGIYPEKGCLLPGSDADVIIYDPHRDWEIDSTLLHMATDYSPYQGLQIRGINTMTISRGEVIYSEEDGWQGKKGRGRFLKRRPTDSYFFK